MKGKDIERFKELGYESRSQMKRVETIKAQPKDAVEAPMTVTPEQLKLWRADAEMFTDDYVKKKYSKTQGFLEDQERIISLIAALEAKDQRIGELEKQKKNLLDENLGIVMRNEELEAEVKRLRSLLGGLSEVSKETWIANMRGRDE